MNSLDLPGKPENTRVVVAMSGGVDSSVVAGLLKRAGYEVIGITLQLYNYETATYRPGVCCAGRDIDDARKVCEALDIPHYVLDYKTQFYNNVVIPFAEGYSIGETPIPCIACNQSVKFTDLLRTSKALGADALATGHYIRSIANDSHRALFRPIDSERDQSYFLFSITQEQIDYLRFPLGNLQKHYVRELAITMGLSAVANKRDSQDICFIQNKHYSSFIKELHSYTSTGQGEIVHVDGRVLGRHNGIVNFTIGQRKKLGISIGEALYVVRIDALTSRVIVGSYSDLKIHRIYLRDSNWLGDISPSKFPNEGMKLAVRVRSTCPAKQAILSYKASKFQVEFPDGEYGIAPGQACVFYSDQHPESRILGGGFIDNSE